MEDVVRQEKLAYEGAVVEGPKYPAGSNVDLDMRVLLVHGDEVISDSNVAGLSAACEAYKKWLDTLEC